jgi:hypothetical protein
MSEMMELVAARNDLDFEGTHVRLNDAYYDANSYIDGEYLLVQYLIDQGLIDPIDHHEVNTGAYAQYKLSAWEGGQVLRSIINGT